MGVMASPSLEPDHGIVAALTKELDQYDSLISLLSNRAAAVLTQPNDSPENPGIEAAPVNELQRLVNRLGSLNRVMHDTVLRIQT